MLYSCKIKKQGNPEQLKLVRGLCENKEECKIDVSREVFGGFDQFTNHLSKNLDIKLNSPVSKINYLSDKIEVFVNEKVYIADVVVISVSLGVLQKNLIEFIPDLPVEKKEAINNISWGSVNKVIFKFPYNF